MNRQRFERYSTYVVFGSAFAGAFGSAIAAGYAADSVEMSKSVQYASALAGGVVGSGIILSGTHYLFKGLERIIYGKSNVRQLSQL